MAHYYLGVDGGQSSTTALIANETGQVTGFGRGGPCNHVRTSEGRAKFIRALSVCLDESCRQAGLDARTVEFSSVCLGFSGGAEDKDAYSRELIRSAKYKITHDAYIALSGATAGRPGVIVIAGTGSMAFGRNAAGSTARAGGWGYIFGDEGSALDLVRRALRAALKREEGWGPQTTLRSLLLEAAGALDTNDLLHRFYTDDFPRTKIASFAPLVTEAAEDEDEIAREILNQAAADLAKLVEAVYKQLFCERDLISLSYVGGVFESTPLLARFKECVRAFTNSEAHRPRFGPAAGALLEALRLDGNESELSGNLAD